MKLKINNEYQDVDMGSFVKCHLLAQLVLAAIIYGSVIVLALLLGYFGL